MRDGGIRPFSWGQFGRLPDPPEPIECDGKFDAEKCVCCMGYEDCAKEWLEEDNDGED